VLDDDPTGVQTLAGVRVLLAWDAAAIAAALAERAAVHVITNSRALPMGQVQTLIEAAGRDAREGWPEARIILRGDSTLRGHLLEEYLGVRQVVAPNRWPVLLLVPALPSAGRVTRGGVHFFVRNGISTPVSETEYAQDGVFAYGNSRLVQWAEERSGGLFAVADGEEIHLERLRFAGPEAVAEALVRRSAVGRPSVVAPDAESAHDLALIAAGYELAVARDAAPIVRCAPAFAGVVAKTTATSSATLPHSDRVLVVCGSYVPQATRQLARLLREHVGRLVEVDVTALLGSEAEARVEVRRVGDAASGLLATGGVAIVATPRQRRVSATSLSAGNRVAAGLAGAVQRIVPRPAVLVSKGGITSAVTLRDGVGAKTADVVGPVEPGVSRWSAAWPDLEPLDYLVVPGNVGDDTVLARLVAAVRGSSPC
jgi:uncharacterized protein YgbK (DUF1537 family)